MPKLELKISWKMSVNYLVFGKTVVVVHKLQELEPLAKLNDGSAALGSETEDGIELQAESLVSEDKE